MVWNREWSRQSILKALNLKTTCVPRFVCKENGLKYRAWSPENGDKISSLLYLDFRAS